MIALTRPLGLEPQNAPASSAVISIVTRSITAMTGGGDSRDTIHGVRNTKCPDRDSMGDVCMSPAIRSREIAGCSCRQALGAAMSALGRLRR